MSQDSNKAHAWIRAWANKRGYALLTSLEQAKESVKVRCAFGHKFERPIAFFSSSKIASSKEGDCLHCKQKKNEEEEAAARPEMESYAKHHDGEFLGWDSNNKSQVIFRCKVGHTIVKNASRVKTALVWCHECLKHQKDAALPEAKYLKLIDRFNAALERKGYRKEQPESKPDELNRVHVRCSKGHLNWMDYSKAPVCDECKKQVFEERLDAVEAKIINAQMKPLGRLTSLGDRLDIECKNGHQFSRNGYHILKHTIKCQLCEREGGTSALTE